MNANDGAPGMDTKARRLHICGFGDNDCSGPCQKAKALPGGLNFVFDQSAGSSNVRAFTVT